MLGVVEIWFLVFCSADFDMCISKEWQQFDNPIPDRLLSHGF